jgi:alpha-beta hydrolase superfamily lysophospholipase
MEGPLSTTDGLVLGIRRWEARRPRATVVLVHGFAASTTQPALVAQAEALVAAGYEVVAYDSRGHGCSSGVCTLGDLEALDVAAAVDRVRPSGLPVVLVGASMGAIAALRYAAREEDPGVAGVVSVSCPAAWRPPRSLQGVLTVAMTRTRLGRVIVRRHMKVRLSPRWSAPASPVELAARIRVPVAVVHGEADRLFPPTEAVRIYRHCRGPRRLDVVPAMGHAFDRFATAAIRAAVDWVLATRTSAGGPQLVSAG